MEFALTGEPITAQRAYEIGLINKVADAGSALSVAKELAKTICANGPLAVAASKQIMVESAEWSAEEMFAKQGDIALAVFVSEDATEGATAFAEKRAPEWKGK